MQQPGEETARLVGSCRRRGRRRRRCWRRGARRSGSPSSVRRRDARAATWWVRRRALPRASRSAAAGSAGCARRLRGRAVDWSISAVQARQRASSSDRGGPTPLPGRRGQRFAVGHGQHERDRTVRRDRDRGGPARLDGELGRAAQRDRERPPLAHQRRGRAAGPGAGGGVRRGGGRTRRRRRPAPPSADRRRTSSVVGSRRPATSATIASVRVSRPPRTAQVVSSVAVCAGSGARRPRRAAAGPTRNVPAVGSADEPAEDGLAVEAGRAEPVDRAVAGDEGRGAGVAEQPVVPDRRRSGTRATAGPAVTSWRVSWDAMSAAWRSSRARLRRRTWATTATAGSGCRS